MPGTVRESTMPTPIHATTHIAKYFSNVFIVLSPRVYDVLNDSCMRRANTLVSAESLFAGMPAK
jgi:hypothetical protein